MPLRYVLDEHLRGSLWDIIQRHNLLNTNPVDTIRIGDSPDIPLGILDPQILLWSEREGRILISLDETSMPGHLADHIASGHQSPGIMVIKRSVSLPVLLEFLVLAAYASESNEWENRITYVP